MNSRTLLLTINSRVARAGNGYRASSLCPVADNELGVPICVGHGYSLFIMKLSGEGKKVRDGEEVKSQHTA